MTPMIDVTTDAKNVSIKTFKTIEESNAAAAQESSATGGTLLPAILFRQGQRWMLTTAFLVPLIQNRLQTNHAHKSGSVDDVRAATNRPVMPDHVKSVKKLP